jgi:uncharacterized membrane protein
MQGPTWFMMRGGQQYGPYPDADMRKFAAEGNVAATDYVWNDSMTDWVQAGTVPGLLPAPARSTGPAVVPAANSIPGAGTPLTPVPHAPTPSIGAPPAEIPPAKATDATGLCMTAYVLQLLVIVPLVPLIGVIIAAVNMSSEPAWIATHYRWQVRTFLIGLLYFFIGGLLLFVYVGALLLIGAVVWTIVRYVKGISALNRRQPMANVATWGW